MQKRYSPIFGLSEAMQTFFIFTVYMIGNFINVCGDVACNL